MPYPMNKGLALTLVILVVGAGCTLRARYTTLETCDDEREAYVEGEGCVPDQSQCPAAMPTPGSECTGSLTCQWGEEQCCGQSHPSEQCSCEDGAWVCWATDACLGGSEQCCSAEETYVEGEGCVPDQSQCPGAPALMPGGGPCDVEGLWCQGDCSNPCAPCYFAECMEGTWVVGHGEGMGILWPPEWFRYDNGTCTVECICGAGAANCTDECLCPDSVVPERDTPCSGVGASCTLPCHNPCQPCARAVCTEEGWEVHESTPWQDEVRFAYHNGLCDMDCVCHQGEPLCSQPFDWCLDN